MLEMELSIVVEPLELKCSEEIVGNTVLMAHQSELLHCDAPSVILDAPTSSGKTLAYLLRAVKNYDTSIIIYPTNALMWDQEKAMEDLLKGLGYEVFAAVEEKNGKIQWPQREPSKETDVSLIVVNGESLTALSESEGSTSEGRSLYERIRRIEGKILILTNLEVLFLLAQYKFGTRELLFDSIFAREGTVEKQLLLVVDEFHLYFGPSLAELSYLVYLLKNYFKQVIFTSATALDPSAFLGEQVHKIRYQEAKRGESGRRVRHRIDLKLIGIDGIIYDKSQIDNFLECMQREMEIAGGLAANSCKVVAILSSVVSATQASKELKTKFGERWFLDNVTEIHGLIPNSARVRERSKFNPVVIGTSAIEVGVDFDTDSLLFEAHDDSAFIQRLGRGGRKRDCRAVAFVPKYMIAAMEQELGTRRNVTVEELAIMAERILGVSSHYVRFASSEGGLHLWLAMLMGIRLYQYQKRKPWELWEFVRDGVLKDSRLLPSSLGPRREDVDGIDWKIVSRVSDNLVGRSSLKSIPAVFTMYNNAWDFVSLSDLPKLKFRTMSKSEAKKKFLEIPHKMMKSDVFLLIADFREKAERLSLATNYYFKNPSITGHKEGKGYSYNFSIYSENNDQDLCRTVYNLLKDQIYFKIAASSKDWRLTGMRGRDDYFVFGTDALLAWEISKGTFN